MGVAVFAGFPLPAAAPVTVGQPPALALGLPLEPCGHQPEPCGHSGVSSPKLLCHQSGETEAGVAKGRAQNSSAQQDRPCGVWVLLVQDQVLVSPMRMGMRIGVAEQCWQPAARLAASALH